MDGAPDPKPPGGAEPPMLLPSPRLPPEIIKLILIEYNDLRTDDRWARYSAARAAYRSMCTNPRHDGLPPLKVTSELRDACRLLLKSSYSFQSILTANKLLYGLGIPILYGHVMLVGKPQAERFFTEPRVDVYRHLKYLWGEADPSDQAMSPEAPQTTPVSSELVQIFQARLKNEEGNAEDLGSVYPFSTAFRTGVHSILPWAIGGILKSEDIICRLPRVVSPNELDRQAMADSVKVRADRGLDKAMLRYHIQSKDFYYLLVPSTSLQPPGLFPDLDTRFYIHILCLDEHIFKWMLSPSSSEDLDLDLAAPTMIHALQQYTTRTEAPLSIVLLPEDDRQHSFCGNLGFHPKLTVDTGCDGSCGERWRPASVHAVIDCLSYSKDTTPAQLTDRVEEWKERLANGWEPAPPLEVVGDEAPDQPVAGGAAGNDE